MDDERYYRRRPKKFLDATVGWDWKLKGLYSVLIDIIMLREDDLPDDAGYIAGMLGCTKNRWTAAKKQLVDLGKISIIDEKIVQTSAKLEQNFRKSKSKQASKNRSKPNKIKDLSNTDVTHRDRDKDISSSVVGGREIINRLIDAAGGAVDARSPDIVIAVTPLRWVSGENPCDLDLDIIPTVRSISLKRGGSEPLTTWNYYTKAVMRARDERLAGNPKPEEIRYGKSSNSSSRIKGIGDARRHIRGEVLAEFEADRVAKTV